MHTTKDGTIEVPSKNQFLFMYNFYKSFPKNNKFGLLSYESKIIVELKILWQKEK